MLTDFPTKVDHPSSTSGSALDESFIETDFPIKFDHEELCTAHTGLSHTVRDTGARPRSVLSASVPQKTKASSRKMVSSFKNLRLAPPAVVNMTAKSSYWLRGTKRPQPNSFAEDHTRDVAVLGSLKQDVRLDRALLASADKESGYSRFFGTKLRHKRPFTDNENGTDKQHSEVKGDGATTPMPTPTSVPTPTPTPTPTRTPEFPDGMVEAVYQANQEQSIRGEPADDLSVEADPMQRRSEEPLPGSVGWHREEDGEEGHHNVWRGEPVEIAKADLLLLGGLSEAQVEGLPEEFQWHVDETPLEAASGYTVPEDGRQENRRLFDLSFDVKSLYLAPGPALYKQHRLPHMAKQAWRRLLQKIRQIFDSFVRNQVRPREGATVRAAVACRAAHQFLNCAFGGACAGSSQPLRQDRALLCKS